MQSIKHDTVEAAYLFYYATDVAFQEGAEDDGRVKKRLNELIGDALIIAGLVCHVRRMQLTNHSTKF